MNRNDFQKISEMRIIDADSLLSARRWPGAYYLTGYSVECALKACICKQVKQYDFPNKELANKSFIHDLGKLLETAGLAPDFNKDMLANNDLELNWAVVKDWSEKSRYEHSILEKQAKDIFLACTDNNNGILQWIKRRW